MKWNVDIKLPTSRAAGAGLVLLASVIVIAIGLYLVKGMADAQTLELEAKTSQIEALQRRLKMPALPAAAG
jgi:hypothetical protein